MRILLDFETYEYENSPIKFRVIFYDDNLNKIFIKYKNLAEILPDESIRQTIEDDKSCQSIEMTYDQVKSFYNSIIKMHSITLDSYELSILKNYIKHLERENKLNELGI
jgi:hypothetical protein